LRFPSRSYFFHVGNYDIAKQQNNVVTYSNELKAVAKDIFDLTKATLANWFFCLIT